MASFREVVMILVTADTKQAVASINAVGASADKDLKKATTGSRNLGDTFLKTGAIMAGVGIAGFVAATAATIKFDQAMSRAGSVAGATGEQLGKLRQAALDAGKDTAFSATEAAGAIGELAKAGISTTDILGGGLKGALSLAAAGELEIADAATIAAQAMNIFGLAANQVGHVADVLAAGSNKSAASVQSLGEGLGNVGSLADAAGIGLEQTVGVLSLFSDNALQGAEGGNALKSMLVAIQSPSREAANAMQKYGIDLFNAKGNFIGLEGTAGQLKTALAGLTQEQRAAALSTIFGSRGLLAANILYKEGAKGVGDYTKAVNDQGAAADVAAQKMDNLAGDIEKLKGSIETTLIEGGSRASGGLRLMVQAADGAVGVFSALPGPVQSTVTALTAFSGVALLATGGIIKFGPAIKNTVVTLADGATAVGRFGVALAASVPQAVSLATANVTLAGSQAGVGATAIAEATAVRAAAIAANEASVSHITLGASMSGLAATSSASATGISSLAAAQAAEAAIAADATVVNKAYWLSLVPGVAIAVGATAAILAIADALGYFDDSITRLNTSAESLGETSIKNLATQMRSLKAETDAQIASMKESNAEFDGSKVSAYKNVMESFNKVLQDSPAFARKFIDAMADAGFSTKAAEGKLRDYIGASKGVAGEQEAAAIATAALSDAIDGGTSAFAEFLKPLNEAAAKTQEYVDGVRSVYDAQFGLIDANEALAESFTSSTATVQDQQKAVLDVASAASQLAVQQLGPGATALQKQKAGFDAQIKSLVELKATYPALSPFIDGYIQDLARASDASQSNSVTNQAAIGVLEALRQKYPTLAPEIDKLIGKINQIKESTAASSVTNQAAIGVLEALKAKYPQLGGEIQSLINKLNDPALKRPIDITAQSTGVNEVLANLQRIIDKKREAGSPIVVPVSGGGGALTTRSAKGNFLAKGHESIVGEEGVEIWVPQSLKVPAKAKPGQSRPALAKKATAGVMLLGTKGESLFTPPVPGTVIPAPKVDDTLERLGLDPKKVPRRAAGGRLARQEYAVVGEEGVELFWPDSAGKPPSRLGSRSRVDDTAKPVAFAQKATQGVSPSFPRGPDESAPRPRQLVGANPSAIARPPSAVNFIDGPEDLRDQFSSASAIQGQGYRAFTPGRADRAAAASRRINGGPDSGFNDFSPGRSKSRLSPGEMYDQKNLTPNKMYGDKGGTNTYHVTVQAGVGNPSEIGKAVVEFISSYEKRNGKSWRSG